MSTERQKFTRKERVEVGSVVLILGLILAALVMAPATAIGQTNGSPTLTPTPETATNPTNTPTPNPALQLSSSSGLPGAQITINGSGFAPNETVDVTFNGQAIGQPTVNSGGTWSLSFTIPNLVPGDYTVIAKGRASGDSAFTTFTIKPGGATLTFNPTQAPPGASVTATGVGFKPGETVQLSFNGPTVGTTTADTNGQVSFTFTIPATLAPGTYIATATGQTSNVLVNQSYAVIAGPTPVPPVQPTATATPVPVPQPTPVAPPIVHDNRYFSQTGYRIDDDTIWAFFQQYGGIATFGYPTSRMMTFLGCPVQMFQRQIIQVCQGQGAALINLLDPEIFPYTQVNGSTFPASDPTMKANTPQVGSPTYSTDIINFINQNVPDMYGGQPVNFLQHFNSTGGLVIWGAPISQPAPDPSNANFIYQRFQRGIMHFIAGTGTESILLADYFKDIIVAENLPADLQAESAESIYYNQYCPGQPQWLCRPNVLPATDLTFAFVQG